MLVSDIISDATEVLGYCDKTVLYSRLTQAISLLKVKGNWEPLLGYLDITVSGNVVTLPPQVESVLKININGNPSFSRNRMYEFSLNGPGSDMADTAGFSWMDKGPVPVMVQPSSASTVIIGSNSPSDNGLVVTVTGLAADNNEYTESATLNSSSVFTSAHAFTKIIRVEKPVTVGFVTIAASVGNVTLSTYQPTETRPYYRQIRLSVSAPAVKILFRRKTYAITSDSDFIPLNSQMAILLMLRAVEGYRRAGQEDLPMAKAWEAEAVRMCQEEQASRTGFDLASTESQGTLDISYNNRDSIIMADLYDDMAALLGPVGRQKIFDHTTEALEVLNNKGQWDGLDGYIDITVDSSTVTLPRYVETPIAVNVGGRPTYMRNRWFEFHLNGTGSDCGSGCPWTWDDKGDVVTWQDVSYPQQLVAIADLPTVDNGKYLRVIGYDVNDIPVRTTNPKTGLLDDGYWMTINSSNTVPVNGSPAFSQITRIIKDPTLGFVKLQGFDASLNTVTDLGYYYPDETEPNYRRIKIGGNCAWVRMRYRKRTIKISSLTDPLHLKSKLPVMLMARSLVSMKAGDIPKANEMAAAAVQLLSDEQNSRNPADTFSLSFDTGTYMGSSEFGQY